MTPTAQQLHLWRVDRAARLAKHVIDSTVAVVQAIADNAPLEERLRLLDEMKRKGDAITAEAPPWRERAGSRRWEA
jgi:hypothetical protein